MRFASRILCLALALGAITVASTQEATWSIGLRGVREEQLTPWEYEQIKAKASIEITVESRSGQSVYSGIPLHLIVARIDGSPHDFDRELWDRGYDVTVTAKDGYTVTFDTAELAFDALILADRQDGKPIAPQLVGETPKSLWVKDVVEIELDLDGEEGRREEFSLVLEINDRTVRYAIEELEAMPQYVEARGSYTTSSGTTFSGTYGGVGIAALLDIHLDLEGNDTVTLVAMDGYAMDYSGEQILDESGGVWILAFKRDGEYLPKDPGYIRTIKVGPEGANIDGRLSVRMVERIRIRKGR